MVKGTSSILASVCASRVLPLPVGPISRTLLLVSSTSASSAAVSAAMLAAAGAKDPFVMIVDGDREDTLGPFLPDHVLVQMLHDGARAGDGARRMFA